MILRLRILMLASLLFAVICTYGVYPSIDLLVKSGSKEVIIKVDSNMRYSLLRREVACAFGHSLNADVFAIDPVKNNFAYLAGDGILSDKKMTELSSIRWLSVLIFDKPAVILYKK